MACLTSTTPLQKHLLLFTLCKYPSSLNAFQCHLSHFLTLSSPLNHTPMLVVRPRVSVSTHAKLSTTNHDTPTETMNYRTREENVSGFSSLRTGEKRVDRKSLKSFVSSEVEENAEKRFTKDRNARKDQGFRKKREMGYKFSSSIRHKKSDKNIKSLEAVDSNVVNGKVEKKSKIGGGKLVKKEKEINPNEIKFRAQLDMCSKRGDVMAAIQLYDLAQRERIRLGQYHYTVILYLCSSAAVGVVRPAKSGTDSRTPNVILSSGISDVNELTDKDDRTVSAAQLDIQVASIGQQLVHNGKNPAVIDKMESNSNDIFDDFNNSSSEKENLGHYSNGNGFSNKSSGQLDGLGVIRKVNDSDSKDDNEIWVSEDLKKYALQRGLEIYDKMCSDQVPMNEATLTAMARMAMSMGNGDMAFDMVKQMKPLGINPRLRSYIPALSTYCNNGEVDKAFAVEKHMLEHGVHPEEPELEALLRVSVDAGKGDKVYYLLHKLRTSVRKVSPSIASIIVRWFESKAASRVGKMKWDPKIISKAIVNGGGGWHGQGWLGKGTWTTSYASVGPDAGCSCCGEKLVTVDLDPIETENFAESVASIAIKRDKDSSFRKFQEWLDYYGPFEAVIDGANVGLFGKKRFIPAKINTVVNGIRQKLPSKKWPLVVLHNKRITGLKMDEMANKGLVEKWKNADALYLTPTGSNDDWYWLYAAIKFKCLIVTNDEMRDHTFQLLGNDFFPKWKERHQVHFSFTDAGPIFYLPTPYSVVIQESEKGHWHIPIATDHDNEAERAWVCITRSYSYVAWQNSVTNSHKESQAGVRNSPKEVYKNLRYILSASVFQDNQTILPDIEAAEKLGDCVIDFQI